MMYDLNEAHVQTRPTQNHTHNIPFFYSATFLLVVEPDILFGGSFPASPPFYHERPLHAKQSKDPKTVPVVNEPSQNINL
jgi:hypothetical protein